MKNKNLYIHGFHQEEQQRLLDQALYWREALILPDLPYQALECLLEVGCGAGAVLREIATAHPGLRLTGLDRVPEQIAMARSNLAGLRHPPDLRVGDALHLPWQNNSFDHVYMMWFLEHVNDPQAALDEAMRVLRPGGSITINETDYTTLVAEPETEAVISLRNAFCALFDQYGRASTGPNVSHWLKKAGFEYVENRKIVWEFGAECDDRQRHAEYLLGFIEPSLDEMGALEGYTKAQIAQGLADVRAAALHRKGKVGMTAWRVRAYK